MKNHLNTKVHEFAQNVNFINNNIQRKEFLGDLVLASIERRSVIFSELAESIPSEAQTDSVVRRIQMFFSEVVIDYEKLCCFLLSFFPKSMVVLSMDRTEWDFGKTQVNILCVVASIGRMAIPLYFEMLDNNSGNSNCNDRISVLESILRCLDKSKIYCLVMDREFIGANWFSWLKEKEIPFCVRVPKHHKITFRDGERRSAAELFQEQENINLQEVYVNTKKVNVSISKGKDGELLYLVGTAKPADLRDLYKKRWGIEVLFQALKDRGFDMEKSRLRDLKKYRKLFAVVSIAYTVCWACGHSVSKKRPAKRKTHGYPQYSMFRRGLNMIREFMKGNELKMRSVLLRIFFSKLKSLDCII